VSGEERFDAAYYERFYGGEQTRVHGPEQVANLGAGLLAMIAWYGGRVRSVLEVGAGTGLLRDWFAANRRTVRYTSTEYSAYAARAFGHKQRDIATWRSARPFDLVVCQGVLPYLSDADARAAIENLAFMTRGFLYLEAITKKDYATVADQKRTDPAMRLRPASFYRRALAPHYQPVGGGLFYKKDGPLVFWELETTGRAPG
jgi:hypothetical protein